MSENEKTGFAAMLKLGCVLALYAAAACVGLAFVYAGTAGIIAERQIADENAALKELFPDGDRFQKLAEVPASPDPSVIFETAYEIFQGQNLAGVVIRTSRASYGGDIKILTGVSAGGKISGVKILEHTDTPGLGANAASDSYYIDRSRGIHFYDQFTGKSVNDPFAVKEDVVIITASTITSAAVSASVKAAGIAGMARIKSKGGAE